MRWRSLSALGLLAAALAAQSAEAASTCASPPGTAGDIIYNSTYNRVQYCDGTNWVNMGSSGSEVGIGTLTAGDFCTSDGSLINCTTGAINLTSQVTGTLQAAQFPALTGDVTTSSGSLVTHIATGKVTNAMLSATGTASSSTFLRGDGIWAALSSIAALPGGANTQVQFNNAGAFAGDANFTYAGAGAVTINGAAMIALSVTTTADNATAILANANGSTNGTAGLFQSSAPNGVGVNGNVLGTGSSIGGAFRSAGATGRGVFGWASNSMGATYGGYFENDSSSGIGLYSLAGTPSTKGLVVQGAASQTGDLTEWQVNGGAVVAKVDAAGNITAPSFSGAGSALTNLNASNLATGTVPTAQLGSGTASSSTYLRGDGTWATVTASATPAGSNTQVQYNNNGALGASSSIFTGTMACSTCTPTTTNGLNADFFHTNGLNNGQIVVSGTYINSNSTLMLNSNSSPYAHGLGTGLGVTIGNSLAVGATITSGHVEQLYGNYIWPGRNDGSGSNYQTNWYLASNGSYGLYTNTGLYAEGSLWSNGCLYMAGGGQFCNNGDHYMAWAGTWASSWLNQSVASGSNPTFGNIYLNYGPGWISNWLNQSVANGSSPVFSDVLAQSTCGCWVGITLNTLMSELNSDARLKRNIVAVPDSFGLDIVMKLRPVTFLWKDKQLNQDQGSQIGFIAQDVERILPQVVSTAKRDIVIDAGNGKETIEHPKLIAYPKLVVPLVKAVQELKTANDDLTAERAEEAKAIAELRKELDELKETVRAR